MSMNTAEQILNKHITNKLPNHDHRSWVLCAMEEYASQQNAELKQKITRIIESYERELKAWENMETNDLNRGFADGNKRAINAMLIDLKTIKH
jgi:hypothetical protein